MVHNEGQSTDFAAQGTEALRPEGGDLLERLKAATGPDRELDAAIARFLGQRVTYSTEINPQPCGDDDCYLPSWSRSLDAALELVERTLPGTQGSGPSSGWKITLYRGMTPTAHECGYWDCNVREHAREGFTAAAPTPALALLIALVMARNASTTDASLTPGNSTK